MDAHTGHWSNENIYSSYYDIDTFADRIGDPDDQGQMLITELSSSSYRHLYSNNGFDFEYFHLLVTLAKSGDLGVLAATALLTRGTVEASRAAIGNAFQYLNNLVDAALNALVAIANTAITAAVAWGAAGIDMAVMSATWAADTLIGFANFTVEAWNAAVDWGVDTVTAISSWTGAQWGKAVNWTADAWETLGNWTASHRI